MVIIYLINLQNKLPSFLDPSLPFVLTLHRQLIDFFLLLVNLCFDLLFDQFEHLLRLRRPEIQEILLDAILEQFIL